MARQRALERSRAEWVVGFDLSPRGAAACALPANWVERMDWGGMLTLRVDQPSVPFSDFKGSDLRAAAVVEELRAFLYRVSSTGILGAFVENYAFSRKTSSITSIAELGGAVKQMVLGVLGESLRPVASNTARALLCGVVPKKSTSGVEVKDYVGEYLRRAGATFASHDEADAFVVANYGLSELGRPALIGASV